MAYGLKYTRYKQRGTDRVTVNIYAKDWAGATYELATLTGLSLQIQGAQGTPYSPIIKTSVAIALRDAFDEGSTASDGTTCVKDGGKWGQWEEFYTNDSTKFRVELLHGSTVIWKGYITPDSWGEDMTYRGVINLTARDMLGTLSEKEFDLTGAVSIRDIVEGAMTAGEIPMAVSFEDEECLINGNDENILDATVKASVFGGKSWYQALEQTLEATGLVLRYDGRGGFYVTSLRYAYTHAADTATPSFTGGSGYRSLDPAAKQIIDTFNPKLETVEAEDPADDEFTQLSGTYTQIITRGGHNYTIDSQRRYRIAQTDGWTGDYAIPQIAPPYQNTPDVHILFPTDIELNGAMAMTYKTDKIRPPYSVSYDYQALLAHLVSIDGQEVDYLFAPANGGSIEFIVMQFSCKKDGTTYYLNNNSLWSTTQNSMRITPGQKVFVPSMEGATDYKFEFGWISTVGEMPPTEAAWGTLAPLRFHFSAPETSDLAAEYKTTTVYNEANHVEISRKPEIGSANTALSPDIAVNILAFDGVAAPDEWGFSDMNGHFPLSVMVQAQLLVFYAAQNGNSIFTGSFIQSDKRTALPGRDYTYYQRNCAMLAGTFDFISGMAQSVTLREIAQWSDIWESFDPQYTQKESSQAGGTAASGGGSSSGGGGGGQGGGGVRSVGLSMPEGFDVEGSPVTSSGEIVVNISSGYNLLTAAQKAIIDLFGIDEDGNVYLKKDADNNPRSFYAYGEITAGGVGSGGGGGVNYLYMLEDVPDYRTAYRGKYLRAKTDGSGVEWVDVQGGASAFDDLTGRPKYNGVAMTSSTEIPAVPTALSQLSDDTNHRLVTDSEKTTWNGKQNAITSTSKLSASLVSGLASVATSGAYSDLSGTPTSLPASDVYDWAKASTKPSYAFSEITGTANTSQIPTLAISKISGLQTALDGKYVKPTTGIPYADLASGVQTSLGLADSALQSHQTIYALTVQKNGTTVGTYTPNAAAKTINITDVASAQTLSDLKTWIESMFEKDTTSVAGQTLIKAKFSLYSEGEITAGGVGSGGGGGATYLYQLEDVPDYRSQSALVGKVLKVGSNNILEWGEGGGGGTNIPIQAEAPTDPDVTLWVDTDDEADDLTLITEDELDRLLN